MDCFRRMIVQNAGNILVLQAWDIYLHFKLHQL